MKENFDPRSPQGASTAETRARVIRGLATSPLVGELSLPALQSVLALRIVALCSKAGREPVVELARRFRSLTAAKAFLALADRIGRYWPDRIMVHPPCCRGLSPDEGALALMIDAAGAGDREGFRRAVEGLVRRDRHDTLYAATVELAAALNGNDWRSACPAL
jgi:hypothetical protein